MDSGLATSSRPGMTVYTATFTIDLGSRTGHLPASTSAMKRSTV
jgi:hypothetical protein